MLKSPFPFLQESARLLPRGVSAHRHDEDPAEAEDGGVWWCWATNQWLSAFIQQRQNLL